MKSSTFSILSSILAFSILTSCWAQGSQDTKNNTAQQISYEELVKTLKNFNQQNGNQVSFVASAAISTPCVVHIKTKATIRQTFSHPFHDFFGHDFFYNLPHERTQQNSGSGVIVSADGYIVTNNHVIQGADEIEVVLRNKSTYKAKKIGTDKDTDIALLKIEESGLPYLRFANSDSVQVGEWVLAVGNPFNLESTVTQGIVSAKGRSLNMGQRSGANPIESFIQTDAAVNPGNSGGALVNLNGELIGINTAIASPTGAYAGYAFAVPSNLVQKVVEDIKKFGNVQRAYLGVEVSAMTSERAKEFNLSSVKGIVVERLVKGGSAESAGLMPKDIILKINDKEVNSFPELQEIISQYRPGDKVQIHYLRNGITNSVSAQLKNKDGKAELVKASDVKYADKLGLKVVSLSAQEMATYQTKGVKVIKVEDGMIKNTTDLRAGFIIQAVGEKTVETPEDFAEAVNNTSGKTIVIEGIYPGRPFTYSYSVRIPGQ